MPILHPLLLKIYLTTTEISKRWRQNKPIIELEVFLSVKGTQKLVSPLILVRVVRS